MIKKIKCRNITLNYNAKTQLELSLKTPGKEKVKLSGGISLVIIHI